MGRATGLADDRRDTSLHGPAKRRAGWRAVGLASLFLMACDPVPVASRLGVSKSAGGDVVVHFASCPDEEVAHVAIIESHGRLGDDDDEVLWAIDSTSGGAQQRFTAGGTPSGFVEESPLRRPLPSDATLTGLVRTSDGLETATAFVPRELGASRITTADGSVPRERFVAEAEESC